jgi:hypothetical protein
MAKNGWIWEFGITIGVEKRLGVKCLSGNNKKHRLRHLELV